MDIYIFILLGVFGIGGTWALMSAEEHLTFTKALAMSIAATATMALAYLATITILTAFN